MYKVAFVRNVALGVLASLVVGCASGTEASATEADTPVDDPRSGELPAPHGGASPSTLPRTPMLASLGLSRRPPRFVLHDGAQTADVTGPGYTARVDGGEVAVSVQDASSRASVPLQLQLHQESISRGGKDFAEGGVNEASGRGVKRVYKSGVVANLQAQPEGLEQTWAFATKPAGGADLVVRVPYSTAMNPVDEGGGLLFYDPIAQIGLRVGRTAWVSGDGTRTALVPMLVDDAIELRVPADVLETSTYPAILDPLFMPSNTSGTDYYASSVASAHTGETLACYENYAVAATPKIQCRLWSGTPGTFTTVVPSTGAGAQYEPNVTYDRATSSFMVVWRDMRGARAQTYMTNVTTAGTLRIADTYISSGRAPDNTFAQYSPKVACLFKTVNTTGHCNVVWGAITGNSRSEAWTSDFQFRSPSFNYVYVSSGSQEVGVTVANVTLENYAPSTAADTNNFITVWEKDVDGLGQTKTRGSVMAPGGCTIDFLPTIATAGALTGGFAFSETGNQMSPNVIWNGNTGVAYVTYVTDRAGNRDVRIRRINYAANFGGCAMTSNAGGTGTDVSAAASDQDYPVLACVATTLGSSCAVTLTNAGAPGSINARLFTTSNTSPYMNFVAPMFAVGGAGNRQTSGIGGSGTTFQIVYDERTASGVWKIGANSFDTSGTVSLASGVMASP